MPCQDCQNGATRSYDFCVRARVRERGVDERLLSHPVAHASCPAVELRIEAVEMRVDVLVHTEVDQSQTLRCAIPDRAVVACHASTSTSGGGETGSTYDAPGIRTPAASPASSVSVAQVADVVRRVTLCRERLPAEDVAVGEPDVCFRHGREFSPERVEEVAVEPPRRALEARGVDEMGSTDLGDPNGQLRVLADERPGRTCMVEMDVREQQVADVVECDAACGEPASKRLVGRGRAAVEERRAVVGLDEVDPDRTSRPAKCRSIGCTRGYLSARGGRDA